MKNRNKIMKELKEFGLMVKTRNDGINIQAGGYDTTIYGSKLRKIITIADKYHKCFYIDFDEGFVRIH